MCFLSSSVVVDVVVGPLEPVGLGGGHAAASCRQSPVLRKFLSRRQGNWCSTVAPLSWSDTCARQQP
eukprot:1141108-Pyramimonas_sp.AAC.1